MPSTVAPLGFSWREPRESDLDIWLRQDVAGPRAPISRTAAVAAWQKLLRTPSLIARVIEAHGVDKARRPMALCASVFVTPQFLDRELADPRPGLPARVIAAITRGRNIVLTRAQIGDANAGSGLHAVFLSTIWWPTSNPVDYAEMMTAGVSNCAEAHAGYRLRSFSVELSAEQFRSFGAGSGFVLRRAFPDVDRVLVHTTREGAAATPLATTNFLFRYREPRLGLHPSDQRLLAAALNGGTDRELAATLGVSVPAVKKRWQAIFQRVEHTLPELFAHLGRVDHGKRGPQRRHIVLSHLRDRPEELRPFRRRSRV